MSDLLWESISNRGQPMQIRAGQRHRKLFLKKKKKGMGRILCLSISSRNYTSRDNIGDIWW